MSDIVDRLRAYAAGESAGTWQGELFNDAAAEIERLREVLRRCLSFIENTESELGITLATGDRARAALDPRP